MSKFVIFLHGRNGFGTNVWFRTAVPFAESLGARVIAPSFPDASDPSYSSWATALTHTIASVPSDAPLYFVTHSMGGYLLLRYLSECSDTALTSRVYGAVLVGCPATKRPSYLRFYDADIDWCSLRRISARLTFLHSRDDTIVTSEHPTLISSELRDMRGFSLVWCEGCGHFMGRRYEAIESALSSLLSE